MKGLNLFIKASLIVLLIVFHTNSICAQQLNIKNTKNGKVRVLKTNQKMFFKLSASEDYAKGKIHEIKDSSLVIYMPEEDEVMIREIKLSEFYAFKKISGIHKLGYFGGAVLMLGGTTALLNPQGYDGNDGSSDGTDWLVRGLGAVTFAVGLIPYLIKPTEYVKGENAEFSITK